MRWRKCLLKSTTAKIQLAAGRWDTCDTACNRISHCALKGDEVFQIGTYFLPAHAFWCLFSWRASQVGSEATVARVPNGSCRRSFLKPVLPLPAKCLSKFPRSILAPWRSGRSSHVVAGLALLSAWKHTANAKWQSRTAVLGGTGRVLVWPIAASNCPNCCRCLWQLAQGMPPFAAPIKELFFGRILLQLQSSYL